MNNPVLSKSQKLLLVWTALFIIGAEMVKRAGVEGRAATYIGMTELLLAIATGVAFGLAASAKNKDLEQR